MVPHARACAFAALHVSNTLNDLHHRKPDLVLCLQKVRTFTRTGKAVGASLCFLDGGMGPQHTMATLNASSESFHEIYLTSSACEITSKQCPSCTACSARLASAEQHNRLVLGAAHVPLPLLVIGTHADRGRYYGHCPCHRAHVFIPFVNRNRELASACTVRLRQYSFSSIPFTRPITAACRR